MKKIKSLAVIALFVSTTAMAQGTGAIDFEEDVTDTAPIPGIALAIAAAIGIGFVKLKPKK